MNETERERAREAAWAHVKWSWELFSRPAFKSGFRWEKATRSVSADHRLGSCEDERVHCAEERNACVERNSDSLTRVFVLTPVHHTHESRDRLTLD